MKQSSVISLKHHRGANNVKFGKPHIPKGKRRHKAFDIVISGAGQRFTMPRAIEMVGLSANLKRVLAGLQYQIHIRIACYGGCVFENRIMCCNK